MTIYTTVFRNSRARGAELAVALAKGEPINAKNRSTMGRSKFHPIRSSGARDENNLRETVIADGFHKAEAVFQGR
jgi:hypothetical protein